MKGKMHLMVRKTSRNYWTACKMRRSLHAPGSASLWPSYVDCKRCMSTSAFASVLEEELDSKLIPDWLKYQQKMGYGGFTRRR